MSLGVHRTKCLRYYFRTVSPKLAVYKVVCSPLILEDFWVNNMWGNILVDWSYKPLVVLSGGILILWKCGLGVVTQRFPGHDFVGIGM